MIATDEPFLRPIPKRWIPREMTTAPALDHSEPRGFIERRYALLINPFYPKDANASFGKHVLTPSLALTSFAATTPARWRVEYWDENLLDGRPPFQPLPHVVGITVHLTFARRAFELADSAIDRDLLDKFKELFGYPRGAKGSLVPGGAFANLTALLAARDALEPAASVRGTPRIAIIVGAQAHYSVARSAAILGLGRTAVFPIPLDSNFCTDVGRVQEAFAAARKSGFRKFILVGSSGSTPTGSFDDLGALRRLATEHRAWFHVDAAHGAGLAFSRRLRKLLKGIGTADSITFDPHKMMFMPLSAGGVLVRDGNRLLDPLQEKAPYLFGSKRRFPDLGQLTIACSQRFDALKTWIVWRAYGPQIWDTLVTHVCEVAQAAFEYCAGSEILEAVHKPHSNIFCFRLRGAHRRDSDQRHWSIKEELNESGRAYISSTMLDGRRVLRLVVMNPRTTADDIRAIIRTIEKIARAHKWA